MGKCKPTNHTHRNQHDGLSGIWAHLTVKEIMLAYGRRWKCHHHCQLLLCTCNPALAKANLLTPTERFRLLSAENRKRTTRDISASTCLWSILPLTVCRVNLTGGVVLKHLQNFHLLNRTVCWTLFLHELKLISLYIARVALEPKCLKLVEQQPLVSSHRHSCSCWLCVCTRIPYTRMAQSCR